jgi:hypothetical protein
MMPIMREHEIAPAEELDRFEEYERQLRQEVEQGIRMLILHGDYHVWARKPS